MRSLNIVAPTAQRSVRASTSSQRPRACSGGMYAGVPIVDPGRVVMLVCARVARACARCRSRGASPAASGEEDVVGLDIAVNDALLVRRREHVEHLVGDDEHLLDAGSELCRSQRRASVSPSSSSITRNTAPSSAMSSSQHLDRAGVLDLVGGVPLLEKAVPHLGIDRSSAWSILIATFLPLLRWVAEYTAAMPPTPTSDSSLHLAFSVAPTRCLARAVTGSFGSSIPAVTDYYRWVTGRAIRLFRRDLWETCLARGGRGSA